MLKLCVEYIPSPSSTASPGTRWSEEHSDHLARASLTANIDSMQFADGAYMQKTSVMGSPSTMTQVQTSAYPVFLVDKLKATVYVSSEPAASMLGRAAHRMESLSLYDATVGLKQHHWSRVVAALAMGSSWTALE